ncbi:MAG TPA: zf-HC2 domain-containing protein [Thermodesulfobacteriota bacterium]|nr:zf-HC2 domain-containing protein [Thermodesulfobacteriota bacterium]
MTAEKNSHEEIKLLLPWYLSGKLGADELETVKRHLAECDDCAGEIEELGFMGAAITEPDEALDAAIEMRLPDMEADIMDRINTYEDARAPGKRPAAAPVRTSAWEKVLGFFEGFEFPLRMPAGVAALVLLQLALIIGLVYKVYLGEPGSYVVLSGPEETAASGPVIIVSFVDTATEAEIRQTLSGIGGRIIDGPKAGGLYVVELPAESGSGKSVEKVIEDLRADKEVIKSVFMGEGK